MNLDSFFAHYGISQNPFAAEEARLDPVFSRLLDSHATHPDFPKILGQIDKPSTAVVFGEKGTGKTALRMLVSNEIARHNQQNPDRRVMEVPYDDFNPVLDNLLHRKGQRTEEVLEQFRLVDHQDAILSLAVTRLVDALLGEGPAGEPGEGMPLPDNVNEVIRRMPRDQRVDLAVLAAVYDNPRAGAVTTRWQRLRKKLRLGWQLPLAAVRWIAIVLTGVLLALLGIQGVLAPDSAPQWLPTAIIAAAVLAGVSWGYWGWRQWRLWRLARRVTQETQAVNRSASELRQILTHTRPSDLTRQPLPSPHESAQSQRDSRYQLTSRLMDALASFHHVGMVVLIDRVDEPTAISGEAEKMRAMLWPIFDNKFLQQDRIGLKLLLPIELRHMLRKESPQFFQEARLDKQNMVDRLEWSGATLYDLCSARLRACRTEGEGTIYLTDLFEEDVNEPLLVDALDQMHQPRDAFKFLYQVIQEHCRLVPDDQANYKIAKLTLEAVRRSQSQRVQELYRGLTPS